MTTPTFQVIEKTEFYNRDGHVIAGRTTERVIFESSDPLACLRHRYEVASGDSGYWVELDGRHCTTVRTVRDGKDFGFSDLFLLVEGPETYDAVLNDRLPPVSEREWLLSKEVA
jgi:hypothetical protein